MSAPHLPVDPSRPRLAGFVRAAVATGLLALIGWRVDASALRDVSWTAVAGAAVGASALLVGAQLLSSLRWQAVLHPARFPLLYLLRLYLVGQFFGIFLPTVIGGDAVRALALSRSGTAPSDAVSSVLLDRLLGLLALVAYLLVGLAFAGAAIGGLRDAVAWSGDTRFVIAAVAVGGAVGALLLLHLRCGAPLRRAAEAFVSMSRRAPRTWARWMVLSLAVQAIYLAVWLVLARGMDLRVPPSYFFFAVPVVSFAAMLPVTVSGLGVREGTWILLLAPFGIVPADAVAFSLLYFLCFGAVGALGGLWYAIAGTGWSGRAGMLSPRMPAR